MHTSCSLSVRLWSRTFSDSSAIASLNLSIVSHFFGIRVKLQFKGSRVKLDKAHYISTDMKGLSNIQTFKPVLLELPLKPA